MRLYRVLMLPLSITLAASTHGRMLVVEPASPADVPALVEQLTDPERMLRARAAERLELLRPVESGAPAMARLTWMARHDRDDWARASALRAATALRGNLPHGAMEHLLRHATRDPDPGVRSNAMRLLADVAREIPDAVRLIAARLDDADPHVREVAERALFDVRTDAAHDVLAARWRRRLRRAPGDLVESRILGMTIARDTPCALAVDVEYFYAGEAGPSATITVEPMHGGDDLDLKASIPCNVPVQPGYGTARIEYDVAGPDDTVYDSDAIRVTISREQFVRSAPADAYERVFDHRKQWHWIVGCKRACPTEDDRQTSCSDTR